MKNHCLQLPYRFKKLRCFVFVNDSINKCILKSYAQTFVELSASEDSIVNSLMRENALEIPKISLYLPIYHGTSQEVLEKGIGHLEGSSMPIGGKNTHAVLTGHRGLPSAELFSNLDQLERDDEFYIHILGETLAYKVFHVETVKPEETGHLAIARGRDRITLVTCTPYGINTHRLLVHAKRVPYKEKENTNSQKDTLWKWLMKQKVFLISTDVLVFFIIYFLIRCFWQRNVKKRRRKKNIT